jgi:hypothetical protein
MSVFHDYLLKTSNLPLALTGIPALQAAGILAAGADPQNMLGDLMDGAGLRGRQGVAASSFTGPDGATVVVPARGNPMLWYFAIRATIAPADLTINPADFGLVPCDPVESAAVLGVWA